MLEFKEAVALLDVVVTALKVAGAILPALGVKEPVIVCTKPVLVKINIRSAELDEDIVPDINKDPVNELVPVTCKVKDEVQEEVL